MNTPLPPNTISDLITQWISRLETHKRNIATEEKITEMKRGEKTAYYIQHAEENTLPSSDHRRQTIRHYKNFADLMEDVIKQKQSPEDVLRLLDSARESSKEWKGKKSSHAGLNKIHPLLNDFFRDLHHFIESIKKTLPSDEIKR